MQLYSFRSTVIHNFLIVFVKVNKLNIIFAGLYNFFGICVVFILNIFSSCCHIFLVKSESFLNFFSSKSSPAQCSYIFNPILWLETVSFVIHHLFHFWISRPFQRTGYGDGFPAIWGLAFSTLLRSLWQVELPSSNSFIKFLWCLMRIL